MFRAGIFNYANCKLAAISAHVLTGHARVTWSIQFWDNLTPRFPDPHLPIHFLPFNVTRSCLKPVFYAICCNLCTFPVWHPNMGIAHALYYVNCAWGGGQKLNPYFESLPTTFLFTMQLRGATSAAFSFWSQKFSQSCQRRSNFYVFRPKFGLNLKMCQDDPQTAILYAKRRRVVWRIDRENPCWGVTKWSFSTLVWCMLFMLS